VTAEPATRLVFTGEGDAGRQVMVEWWPGDDAEVLYVSTRPSPFARWSPPVECTKQEP
jgi:hypothetical protein